MNYIIRDDKEHETTAPKVKVIAPRKKFQPSYNDRQNRKIRVGAYCRVSTDSDEQELSYETQCEAVMKTGNLLPFIQMKE